MLFLLFLLNVCPFFLFSGRQLPLGFLRCLFLCGSVLCFGVAVVCSEGCPHIWDPRGDPSFRGCRGGTPVGGIRCSKPPAAAAAAMPPLRPCARAPCRPLQRLLWPSRRIHMPHQRSVQQSRACSAREVALNLPVNDSHQCCSGQACATCASAGAWDRAMIAP